MDKKDNHKDKEKSENKPKPKVHKELNGFDISIDQFGEIKSNMNIEKINAFLNENVDDKKLAERDDYEDMKKPQPKKRKDKPK
jgi:hypothetical protein